MADVLLDPRLAFQQPLAAGAAPEPLPMGPPAPPEALQSLPPPMASMPAPPPTYPAAPPVMQAPRRPLGVAAGGGAPPVQHGAGGAGGVGGLAPGAYGSGYSGAGGDPGAVYQLDPAVASSAVPRAVPAAPAGPPPMSPAEAAAVMQGPPPQHQLRQPMGGGVARRADPASQVPESLQPLYGGQLYPADYLDRVDESLSRGEITPEQAEALQDRHSAWLAGPGIGVEMARRQQRGLRGAADDALVLANDVQGLRDQERNARRLAALDLADSEDRRRRREAERQRAMAEATQRYQRVVTQMDSVDRPARWWADGSTEAQVGAGLLAGFGAMAGIMTGQGGNWVLDYMDRTIDRDIRQQQAELGKLQAKADGEINILGLMSQQYDSQAEAEAATRAAIYERLANESELRAGQMSDLQMQQRAKSLAQQLREKAAQNEDLLRQSAWQAQMKREELEARMRIAAQQAAARAREKAADPYGQLEWSGMGADERKRHVPGVGLVSTFEDAKEIKETMAAMNTLEVVQREIAALADKPGHSISPADRGKLAALQNRGRLMSSRLYQLGAISEADKDLVDGTLGGDAGSLLSMSGQVQANIDTAINTGRLALRDRIQMAGVDPVAIRRGPKGPEMAYIPTPDTRVEGLNYLQGGRGQVDERPVE